MSATTAELSEIRAWSPATHARPWLSTATIVWADLIGLASAAAVAVLARWSLGGEYDLQFYFRLAPVLLLFVVAFAMMDLYPGFAMNPAEEIRRVCKATTATYIVLAASTFLSRAAENYSRSVLAVAWLLSMISVLAIRHSARRVFSSKQWWGVPAVVLGAGEAGRQIVEMLQRRPELGLKVVAWLDDEQRGWYPGLPVLSGSLRLASVVSAECPNAYAIVAMPHLRSTEISEMLERYGQGFRHVLIIPDLAGISSLWVHAKDLGGVLGLEVRQALFHPAPQFVKQATDLFLSALAIALLAPLFLIVALLIRLEGSGSPMYGHRRLGQGRRSFVAWKFRTMVRNADQVLREHLESNPSAQRLWSADRKLRNDPRVTAVGRILRRTSIDELPQLWNVLRGEMSLVGPRPIPETEAAKYGDKFHIYQKVRPGMTGLWQVSGRSNTSYDTRVRLDEYYVRNWSVWLDMFILVRTIKAVLSADGAY